MKYEDTDKHYTKEECLSLYKNHLKVGDKVSVFADKKHIINMKDKNNRNYEIIPFKHGTICKIVDEAVIVRYDIDDFFEAINNDDILYINPFSDDRWIPKEIMSFINEKYFNSYIVKPEYNALHIN
jgi:hypothetical protein